jgi:uncharacterized membrane protein YfcA
MLALSCAFAAAALAGFSRGFAAFGTAMIYVPLVTLAYDTKTAVVTLFLVDMLPAIPLVWKASPRCEKLTLLWMAAGAVVSSPVGVALLLVADRTASQLVLGVALIAAISFMSARRDFRMAATPLRSIAAGAVSGFAGRVCGIFGPPAMIYLLGSSGDARSSRANAIVFLTGESIVLGVTYLLNGMYTLWYLGLSLMLVPIYGVCTWYGANRFALTSEATYRRIVLCLLWAISLLLVGKSIAALFY